MEDFNYMKVLDDVIEKSMMERQKETDRFSKHLDDLVEESQKEFLLKQAKFEEEMSRKYPEFGKRLAERRNNSSK